MTDTRNTAPDTASDAEPGAAHRGASPSAATPHHGSAAGADFTSDNDLAAIAHGVMDLTLPKPLWTHRAHFAAALWLLARRPDIDAPRVMPGLIRAYNEATGVANTDTEGYHETITQASLRAARTFLAGHPALELFAVVNALMASPLGRSDWLLAYWTKPLLFSVEARRRWVEPDIRELPFP